MTPVRTTLAIAFAALLGIAEGPAEIACAILVVAILASDRPKREGLGVAEIALAVWFLAGLLGLLFRDATPSSRGALRPLAALAFFVGRWVASHEDDRLARRMATAFLAATAVNAAYGILQVYVFDPPLESLVLGRIASRSIVDPRAPETLRLATGLFYNRLKLAHIGVVAAALLAAILLEHPVELVTRRRAVIAACIIGIGVVLTFRRGAPIALAGSFVLLAVLRRKLRVAVVAFTTLIGTAALFLATATGRARIDDATRSIEDRLEIFRSNISLIAEHPLFGVGHGNYARSIEPMAAELSAANPSDLLSQAHNLALHIAAESGLVGALAFAIAVAAAFIGVARRTTRAADREAPDDLGARTRDTFAFLGLATLLILGTVHFVLFHESVALAFFGLLGLAAGPYERVMSTGGPLRRNGGRIAAFFARVGLALVIVAIVVLNFDLLVVKWATPAAPTPSAASRRITTEQVVTDDRGVLRLGPCSWRDHRGQHVFHAEGDAFTIGYCNGALSSAAGVMQQHEAALHTSLATFFPNALVRRFLTRSILVAYHDLPEFVSEDATLEIFGIASGYADPFRELGPTFGRILYYHAIHDIGQALIDNPLFACSAFAASRSATRDGHTLLARVFDFEGGAAFDAHKVVLFSRPVFGHAFASVAWSGMAGAVTGMNEQRIGVTLDAAATDDFSTSGTPTTLVVRAILQYASTIEEAVDIVRNHRVFVSDILTIADGKTGEIAVVEVSPTRVEVRRNDDIVFATNHLLHPAFSTDETNRRRMRDGTTVRRFDRLGELLARERGKLDVPSAIGILRDRKLVGDVEVAIGHRGAIDALIAAHAIVFDLTTLRMWVSGAPHTLGAFVEYDFDEASHGRISDHGVFPEDPLLRDVALSRYERAMETLRDAERLRRNGDDARALELAELAVKDAPAHPAVRLFAAELADTLRMTSRAVEHYRAFLATPPPNENQAERVRERLIAVGSAGAK